ncbi:Na+:solute symporter [Myxococcota bacterium]|nr:Na+:solute symporter [Myxococcota bacterium]MBU1379286.1 Na+:solute symporter [Myxococcota bacterium]MBU1499022.1 Na+:solute symporter [Myxococcota bacterium]
MKTIDWSILFGYIVFSIAVGIWAGKKARKDTRSFFTADSKMSWWLLGTSIAATTFAADTPLAVTEIVRTQGIAGNWLWWNMAISHILLAVVFARLWRRSGVITDAEFIEMRYSGKWAAILRAVKAGYLAIAINALAMGWVMLAMAKVLKAVLPLSSFVSPDTAALLSSLWPDFVAVSWEEGYLIIILAFIAYIYSALSGIWGVVITDFVQFIIAMAGSIMLCTIMLFYEGPRQALFQAVSSGATTVFPSSGTYAIPMGMFLSWIGIQWWANKYSDGGGYIVQRVVAARNEEEASKSIMLFVILHYFIRPWPWILVALMSIGLLGNLTDHQMAYPILMKIYLPAGALGLMVTAFFAAFMSTIDTHINWGSSYLVEDIYRRFLNREKSEKHYIAAAAVSGLFILLGGIIAAMFMKSVASAWKILFLLGAGLGPIVFLRWLWWRINALSELCAMISSAITAAVLILSNSSMHFGYRLMTIAGISTVCALAAAFLGPRTDMNVLRSFHEKIKPPGPFWSSVSSEKSDINLVRVFTSWIAGSAGFVFFLHGIVNFLKSSFFIGFIYTVLTILSLYIFLRQYKLITVRFTPDSEEKT